MPKKKTKKAVAKRFKISAGGRIKFGRPGKSHLLSSKSTKRKRHLRKAGTLGPADESRVRKQLV